MSGLDDASQFARLSMETDEFMDQVDFDMDTMDPDEFREAYPLVGDDEIGIMEMESGADVFGNDSGSTFSGDEWPDEMGGDFPDEDEGAW